MKIVLRLFAFIHGTIAVLFALSAVMLVVIAARTAFSAFIGGMNLSAAQSIIETIGLLAAAVVAVQIAQTIAEEEIVREEHVSGPTRVRRYISRFLVVIVIALVVEALVATFKGVHEAPEQILYAAALVLASGALLAGWGGFIRLNRSAEELEPEAMAEAKKEDKKLK